MKRGSSEQYLKDERAKEDYLIGNGLDGAVLKLAGGEERAAADLRAIVEDARIVRQSLMSLHNRYDRAIVEQAAIAGALHPISPGAEEEADRLAQEIAQRLDRLADET